MAATACRVKNNHILANVGSFAAGDGINPRTPKHFYPFIPFSHSNSRLSPFSKIHPFDLSCSPPFASHVSLLFYLSSVFYLLSLSMASMLSVALYFHIHNTPHGLVMLVLLPILIAPSYH